MDTHKNAPLAPKGRKMMVRAVVELGLSKAAGPPGDCQETCVRGPS